MGITIIWMQVALLLSTVLPSVLVLYLFTKKKIKGKTTLALLSGLMLILFFTPIKLDNSENNRRVTTSFDKVVEEVVIEKKARVEYSASNEIQ